MRNKNLKAAIGGFWRGLVASQQPQLLFTAGMLFVLAMMAGVAFWTGHWPSLSR